MLKYQYVYLQYFENISEMVTNHTDKNFNNFKIK